MLQPDASSYPETPSPPGPEMGVPEPSAVQEAPHRSGREPTVGPAGSEALVPVTVQSCLMNNTRAEHDISPEPPPPQPTPPISERCVTRSAALRHRAKTQCAGSAIGDPYSLINRPPPSPSAAGRCCHQPLGDQPHRHRHRHTEPASAVGANTRPAGEWLPVTAPGEVGSAGTDGRAPTVAPVCVSGRHLTSPLLVPHPP